MDGIVDVHLDRRLAARRVEQNTKLKRSAIRKLPQTLTQRVNASTASTHLVRPPGRFASYWFLLSVRFASVSEFV